MPAKRHAIRLKRIYDAPSPEDGKRVLADRLWPRGIAKVNAQLDLWAKTVTPSNELRQWFHQHTDQYAAFRDRYEDELEALAEAGDETLSAVRECVRHGTVTLLSAVRLEDDDGHEVYTHLQVLRDFLQSQ
ncbi:hypothetical protein PTE30175_03128 [Pandoraea terrae]|uniref:MarR family transcriptional regulator n=1 Tax=Pandoraea terrae TaxID=1537710 RepID=A0A5E4WFR0_9BURK|nr:DUF488 family protein [Pandoraea terrae]VVE22404.1 hypothetical protein PTE30175_03128 [Pandoraea terrae]